MKTNITIAKGVPMKYCMLCLLALLISVSASAQYAIPHPVGDSLQMKSSTSWAASTKVTVGGSFMLYGVKLIPYVDLTMIGGVGMIEMADGNDTLRTQVKRFQAGDSHKTTFLTANSFYLRYFGADSTVAIYQVR